jgi:ribonuclease HII
MKSASKDVSPPTFNHERQLWTQNSRIYGFDECGRGSICGPLIVCGVCFHPDSNEEKLQALGIHDSKKLSAKRREALEQEILKECLDFVLGESTSYEIDAIGIQNATINAINQSLTKKVCDHILMDGNPLPSLKIPHTAIHKGDQLSLSIAAASILGKLHRDRLMSELHTQYEVYQWDKNKGYGSKHHYQAIKEFGLSPHHRTSFGLLQTNFEF